MSITFSTAWYVFKAKFDPTIYKGWIDNMLSNVNNYFLVIYTDETGLAYVEKYSNNPRIRIIIKPYTDFYTYKYRDHWISNHEKNELLKQRVDWKLNMLWSEKINFVKETINNNYFGTDFFGWCDIGYFRGNPTDLTKTELKDWPSTNKILALDKTKILYSCVNNDMKYISYLLKWITYKNGAGLPNTPIPENQISIAGGFFILYKTKMDWWHDTYYKKLELYFENNYLVKDDQIVIADCVFSNLPNFEITIENNPNYDNWFQFQRYLL
jgi:hypothetical protein